MTHRTFGLGLFMAIAGAIGTLSAAILTVEKINLLKNPGGELSCDICVLVGCGPVVNTPEASAFGFPNPILGLVGFPIVITLGVLLASGSSLPKWVWAGLQGGVLFGIGFVTWLQVQSIYDLQVLCPYCMVVWTVMIPLFVIVSGACLRALAPDSLVTRIVNDYRVLIIALWFLAVISAIFFQFGTDLFDCF